jgi:FtsH-binding integral membrane protein
MLVSTFRMKLDLVGQSILLTAAVVMLLATGWHVATVAIFAALLLWQMVSAVQLYERLHHAIRNRSLRGGAIGAVVIVLTYIFGESLCLVPLLLVVLAYYLVTLRDTLHVMNRPKSFWDL